MANKVSCRNFGSKIIHELENEFSVKITESLIASGLDNIQKRSYSFYPIGDFREN